MELLYKSHNDLQAQCTLWYKNVFCGDDVKMKKRLILIYNNPPNARIGAMLKTLGLEQGPSDQLLLAPRKLIWLEYKFGYDKQRTGQDIFEQIIMEYMFCEYHVVRDVTIFQNIVKQAFYGVSKNESY